MLSWYYILVIAFIYSVGRFIGERLLDIYDSIKNKVRNHFYDLEHPEENTEEWLNGDDEE